MLLVSNNLGAGNVSIFSSSTQHITVQCSLPSHTQFITCVYGNILASVRRHLWTELEFISSLISDSWFVMGDFNACFGAHEKLGNAPNAHSCHDFLSAMHKCMLTCLDTKGPLYT